MLWYLYKSLMTDDNDDDDDGGDHDDDDDEDDHHHHYHGDYDDGRDDNYDVDEAEIIMRIMLMRMMTTVGLMSWQEKWATEESTC